MERDPFAMSPRDLSRDVLAEVSHQDRESKRSMEDSERDVQRLLQERAEIEDLAEKQMSKAGWPGVELLRDLHSDLSEQLNWALSRKDEARATREGLDTHAQEAREAERAADRRIDAERREIARAGLEMRIAIRAHQREVREAERDTSTGRENPWTQSDRPSQTFESEEIARRGEDERER